MSYAEIASELWAREPASRPDLVRIRVRIAGMHCSLCTGTIEKALRRHPGVEKVAVSLTHEQALVEYDPKRVQPQELLTTLGQMGYAISDPRKLRPFEQDERLLVREGRRFLIATIFSLGSLSLIARPGDFWYAVLEGLVALCLLSFVFLVLRPSGLPKAIAGMGAAFLYTFAPLWLKQAGHLEGLDAWIAGGLAFSVVFFLARPILVMAWHAVRRGIVNQHVLLEAAAFAGLGGGLYGVAAGGSDFPTAPFFCVAVMVCNYHIFSEWLSLIVKTRSSQAVRRLLELQPETARVVRGGTESVVRIEEIVVGDVVGRAHPGGRHGDRRAIRGGPITRHRRAFAGGTGGGRQRDRWFHERAGYVARSSFRCRRRELSAARRARGGRRPGAQARHASSRR
jgi:Cu+-exporting ATPase